MKKVLITGANSGFGYYMVLEFARNGHYVFATTRDLKEDGVIQISKIVEQENLNVNWIRLDVTKEDDIKDAFVTIKSLGLLDVLVNNAGYGVIGPLESYNSIDVRDQLDTNFFGAIDMIYTFLPLLKKSTAATIINISSIAGLISAPAYGVYSASKWALEAFTEALRYELHKTNIKVALIEPGGFDTEFSANATGLGMPGGDNKFNWFETLKERRNKIVGKAFKNIRNPRRVSKLTYKIAESRNPKIRNVIGVDAKIFYFLRRLLPARIWEMSVRKIVSG